jgi:hypothetical protein
MSRSELLIALTAEVDKVERIIIETAESLDVEALAVAHVELADVIRRLRDVAQTVEDRLAEVMPQRLEVDGLPILERRRGVERRAWQSDELLRTVIRRSVDPEGTGELPSGPEIVERVTEVIERVMPVTPSLGWRATALRAMGLDPDEWCETKLGRARVVVR